VHFYSCIFNARTVQSHSTETVVLRCTLIAQVCGKSLAMIRCRSIYKIVVVAMSASRRLSVRASGCIGRHLGAAIYCGLTEKPGMDVCPQIKSVLIRWRCFFVRHRQGCSLLLSCYRRSSLAQSLERIPPVWNAGMIGIPVRAKWIHASLTFAPRARASGPPPVIFSQRSVLLNANAISAQWNARGLPSRIGVCHVNQ